MIPENFLRTIFTVVLILTGACAQAEIRLAHIFSDHMVLQRGQGIPVWGWAREGEEIAIEFGRQRRRTTTNAQGRWRVVLDAEAAGGPYTLRVRGENMIAVNDVLVGDVWLGSGQSNMEWTVGQSSDAVNEVTRSSWPLIRHVKVPKSLAFRPAEDIGQTQWKVSGPEDTAEFSAVGYFFARKLRHELGIPIGIISASWGGSNIETWLSASALATRPEFDLTAMPVDVAAFKSRYRDRMNTLLARWQPAVSQATSSTTAWQQPGLDDGLWPKLKAPQYWEDQGLEDLDGVVWYRRVIELTAQQANSTATLHLGMIDDCDETFVNGEPVGNTCGWDAPRHYPLVSGLLKPGINLIAVRVTDSGGGGGFHGEAGDMRLQTGAESLGLSGEWKARVESIMHKDQPAPNDLPALLFNAMVSPITDFPIRGVLWYQGESNVTRAKQYTQSFSLLISDWRQQWQQHQLPFYFVQLASFLPLEKNSLTGSSWAELRDAQRQALKLPATGMVVTTDIGNASDIHPRNKQAVGLRLALQALKNVYGRKKLVASGPLYRSMQIRNSRVEISFSEIGHGLAIASNSATLNGFSVADASQRFLPAQARIQGNKVIVSHADIRHPIAVRYGWMDNPEESNLVNIDGLPASPFRSDDWPGLTDHVKYRY